MRFKDVDAVGSDDQEEKEALIGYGIRSFPLIVLTSGAGRVT